MLTHFRPTSQVATHRLKKERNSPVMTPEAYLLKSCAYKVMLVFSVSNDVSWCKYSTHDT